MRSAVLLLPLALCLAACDTAKTPTPADAREAGLPAEATEPANPAIPVSTTSPEPRPPMQSPIAPPTRTTPDDASDACGAKKLGRFVNSLPGDDTLAAIRKLVGERRIRVIHPGDAVTMDHSESRLNVETGEDGRIKTFRCG